MLTLVSKKVVLSCLAIALVFAFTATVWAQEPADTFKIDYFAYANSGLLYDATLRITNPGTSGGNVCANIYVFSPDQQLNECCSCFISPNGLRTLSVQNDLVSNPLTGVKPQTGAIKIVSSAAGSCNAAVVTPVAAVRAWATHLQQAKKGVISVTETASLDATLSASELGSLTSNCAFIQNQGSGHGICSCGTGD